MIHSRSPVSNVLYEDMFLGIFGPPQIPFDDAGDAWEFQVEIPGVKKEDVQVGIKGDSIKVTTSRKYKDKKDERVGLFSVPQNVDLERAEAHVEDGVLTVRLPKSKVAAPKMIPIR